LFFSWNKKFDQFFQKLSKFEDFCQKKQNLFNFYKLKTLSELFSLPNQIKTSIKRLRFNLRYKNRFYQLKISAIKTQQASFRVLRAPYLLFQLRKAKQFYARPTPSENFNVSEDAAKKKRWKMTQHNVTSHGAK
jgi:hypothetical protein